MNSGTTNIKKCYGSFLTAAAAYIAGVLLFSLWSYSAHQNSLRTQADKSLIDAAFSIREILGPDFISALPHGTETNTSAINQKQQSLARVARHGDFSSVGVVSINHGKFTPLISACNATNIFHANDVRHAPPLWDEVQKDLLQLAEAGYNDADLLTAEHPNDDSLRFAVLFQALENDSGIAYLVAQDSNVVERELADQALRLSAAGFGMLLLAIPLITIFSRSQKQIAAELAGMNVRLQHDVELQKDRETELEDAICDLERFNAVTAGRETRIIKLKAEVNELLEQMKRGKRYNIDKID